MGCWYNLHNESYNLCGSFVLCLANITFKYYVHWNKPLRYIYRTGLVINSRYCSTAYAVQQQRKYHSASLLACCVRNLPVTDGFHSQIGSNVEIIVMQSRHHGGWVIFNSVEPMQATKVLYMPPLWHITEVYLSFMTKLNSANCPFNSCVCVKQHNRLKRIA